MDSQQVVVIDDGEVRYAVLRADLQEGDNEARLKAMSEDEYAEWCEGVAPVPAPNGETIPGTRAMNDFCDGLLAAGAERWAIG